MSGDLAQEIGEIEILLDLMRDYLEIDRPADLTPAELEQLLLRVYPRKITVLEESQTVGTISAMSDFITFLAESGALPAARAEALDRKLGRIAPQFGEAVMDPANWGMARSFVTGMVADGVNLDDEADVQRWIANYKTGLAGGPDWEPEGEYWEPEGDDWEPVLGLKDAFGLPDELPPGICCPVTWPTQRRRLGSVPTSSLISGTWRWSRSSPIWTMRNSAPSPVAPRGSGKTATTPGCWRSGWGCSPPCWWGR